MLVIIDTVLFYFTPKAVDCQLLLWIFRIIKRKIIIKYGIIAEKKIEKQMLYCYNILVCMLLSANGYSAVTRKVYSKHGSFGNR
ncbi:MAG: hypothetical protein IJU14_08300 [Clostridia bacterium]|nr:hypothetical protein [Clostridia bacterium]